MSGPISDDASQAPNTIAPTVLEQHTPSNPLHRPCPVQCHHGVWYQEPHGERPVFKPLIMH